MHLRARMYYVVLACMYAACTYATLVSMGESMSMYECVRAWLVITLGFATLIGGDE